MPHLYRAYGRVVQSEIALPKLTPGSAGVTDIYVVLDTEVLADASEWVQVECTSSGRERVLIAADTDQLWFHYPSIVQFACHYTGDGVIVRMEVIPGAPDAVVRHLLVNEVLPAVVTRMGSMLLHGAAVVTGGGALAIVGESGAGKSTLAATLALSGAELLADDCVVIDSLDGGYEVQPSYSSLRLWPETAEGELGFDPVGTPFAENPLKLRYEHGVAFATKSTPLRGIAYLSPASASSVDEIVVKALSGHEAGAAIMRNAWSVRVDDGRRFALAQLLDLATHVPITRWEVPRDLARLDELRTMMSDWAIAL